MFPSVHHEAAFAAEAERYGVGGELRGAFGGAKAGESNGGWGQGGAQVQVPGRDPRRSDAGVPGVEDGTAQTGGEDFLRCRALLGARGATCSLDVLQLPFLTTFFEKQLSKSGLTLSSRG